LIDWLKINKNSVIIGVGGVVLCSLIFLLVGKEEEQAIQISEQMQEGTLEENEEKEKGAPQQEAIKRLMVDVKGFVHHPGVYEVEEGSRVQDVIRLAGGLRENADGNGVNFAMRVEDEMVLYIPMIGEQIESIVAANNTSSSGEEGKVNLNKATETELQTLPGIGPSKAAAIIEYRESNGEFATIEDLQNISGIGEKTFEKLKDLVSVK
jgi:competence protein ComEA